VTDAGLVSLGKGSLRKLALSGCPGITDEGLRHMENFKSLDLPHCGGFIDAGLPYLTDLLSCDQIADEDLRHLGNLESPDCLVVVGSLRQV
jgi:hypothetical protein